MNDQPPVPISGTITVTPPNRWAAFTDDELEVIVNYPKTTETFADQDDAELLDRLYSEIHAELERRKA